MNRFPILLLLVLGFSGVGVACADGDNETGMREVFGILQRDCIGCHSASKKKGGLEMGTRETLIKGGESGAAVVVGKASESFLAEVLFPDADPHMPPKGQLGPEEIQLIEKWIDGGARWDVEVWEEMRKARRTEVVQLGELPEGYAPAMAVALSADGNWLAAGRGSAVEVFDVSAEAPDGQRTPTHTLGGHGDVVQSLAWSPDGKRLAAGSFRKVQVWETAGFTAVLERVEGLAGRVTALEFSIDGKQLIVGDSVPSDESQIHWWGFEKDELVTVDAAHDDTIFDLEISGDGKVLASAGGDKMVRLRDPESGKVVGTLEGHTGSVLTVAFGPDSKRIATAGDDGTVKVWEIGSLKRVSSFGGDEKVTGAITGLGWMVDEAKAKQKAEEKDEKKAAEISADRLVTVNRIGVPRIYSDLVEHEGAQQSAGARESLLGESGEVLHGVALDKASGRFFAGAESGVVLEWDRGGKLRKVRENGEEIAEEQSKVSFRNDVLPILGKAGCAAGACHAKAGGQNGFALSIFAYDPEADQREIVMDSRGRRVFPAAPKHSLLLLKATHAIPHEGGERIVSGSDGYETLVRWIREGARLSVAGETDLVEVVASPEDAIFSKGERRGLAVTARYSDGSERDVTGLCEFVSADGAFAKVDEEGVVVAGETAGDGTVIVRYLDQLATVRVTVPPEKLQPDAAYAALPVANEIDSLAYARFKKLGLLPSATCSDAEFIRRATLDVLGRLPEPDRVRAFLEVEGGKKRERLIDELLGEGNSAAYADYWATKWGDLLRPNTQRVGVKPVYLFDNWIRDRLRENQRYDGFVREILTASGSSHEVGPVALFRDKREPEDIAEFTSRIFLGTRIDCARCHHHPSEKWGQDDYYALASFFSSMKRKGQGISAPISGLPEYWWFAPGGAVKHPVSGEVMVPRPPGGSEFPDISATDDPRGVLVDWMVDPGNPLFARAAVNRIWGEFFGRGIVDPVDDFRASNPPVNEELLDWLAGELVRQNYDVKKLIGVILKSRIYQQGAVPNETNMADVRNFSRSYRRRLPAEVLADAVVSITGVGDSIQGIPDGYTVSMRQWNHKMDSDFLDAFGRPDSSAAPPCERDRSGSAVQALHLMHSENVQRKLDSKEGWAADLARSEMGVKEKVEAVYLRVYSRLPSDDEREVARGYFEKMPDAPVQDLMWALMNSAEFVFNH